MHIAPSTFSLDFKEISLLYWFGSISIQSKFYFLTEILAPVDEINGIWVAHIIHK